MYNMIFYIQIDLNPLGKEILYELWQHGTCGGSSCFYDTSGSVSRNYPFSLFGDYQHL